MEIGLKNLFGSDQTRDFKHNGHGIQTTAKQERKTENYSKEKRKKNIYIKRENEAGVRAGQGNS